MSTTEDVVRLLATPEVIADPYPVYAALRDASPIEGYVDHPPGTVPGRDGPVRAWALLRHDDVVAAARDHRTFSSRDPLQEASGAPTLMLVNTDQPAHTAERKLINKAFTRGRVEALRPWVRAEVATLLDTLPRGRAVEVVDTICAHVPAAVMAHLLGAPPSDVVRYKKWANAFMLSSDMPAQEREASNVELVGAFAGLVGRAREDGVAGESLVGALLAAEVDGERLSVEQIVRFCITLVVAGSETTMYFAANLFQAILAHPSLYARMREDRSLVGPFMDETLRLSGPPQRLFRIATRDVEIGGRTIRAGDWVALFFASANHDPAVFEEPAAFRLDRPRADRHLTFGLGIHYCLGAPLALLEMECLLEALLDRYVEIRPAGPATPQTATFLQHSVTSLPVELVRG